MQKIMVLLLLLVLQACGNKELKGNDTSRVSSNKSNTSLIGGREIGYYQNVVERYKERIFGVYKNELEKTPGIRGRIEFLMHVLENGGVTSCVPDYENEQFKFTAVLICDIIKEMNFGEGQEFDFPYVINFFPD